MYAYKIVVICIELLHFEKYFLFNSPIYPILIVLSSSQDARIRSIVSCSCQCQIEAACSACLFPAGGTG